MQAQTSKKNLLFSIKMSKIQIFIPNEYVLEWSNNVGMQKSFCEPPLRINQEDKTRELNCWIIKQRASSKKWN